MSEALTETDIETLRRGAMGAGLLVSVSDRGFFDTFKEAGTLAKHVAAARASSIRLPGPGRSRYRSGARSDRSGFGDAAAGTLSL